MLENRKMQLQEKFELSLEDTGLDGKQSRPRQSRGNLVGSCIINSLQSCKSSYLMLRRCRINTERMILKRLYENLYRPIVLDTIAMSMYYQPWCYIRASILAPDSIIYVVTMFVNNQVD